MPEKLKKIVDHLSYFGYKLDYVEDESWVLNRSIHPASDIVLNPCCGGFNICIYYTLESLHVSTEEINELNMNLISCKAMVEEGELVALSCWLPYIDDKSIIAHFIEVFKVDAEQFEELVFAKVEEENSEKESKPQIVLN